MKSSRSKPKKWYRLDNASKIFPSIITKRTTTVYRIAVTLKELVHEEILQDALNNVMGRFPYYRVNLKAGIFWHYLQEREDTPTVYEEKEDPCQKFDKRKDGGFLLRIMFFRKRISIEFSHILTDGTGALLFLHTLINEYFKLTGIDPVEKPYLDIKTDPDPEESEDGYRRYYKKDVPPPEKKEKAFHLPGHLIQKENLNITTGFIPLKDLMKKVKEYNVTITEFSAALYLFALYNYLYTFTWEERKKHMKPIRLMVPVNLRKMFPTKTMRNFFLTVTPGIDPRLGLYSFEEILKIVYHYMRIEVNDKFINQQIKRNVGSELNPLIRLFPLVLKLPVKKLLYNKISNAKHSGVLTNMGNVLLPEIISDQIENFLVIPNPNSVTKINVGLISFNDSLAITFASFLNHRNVEKIFFRLLRKMGIPVKIETNEE